MLLSAHPLARLSACRTDRLTVRLSAGVLLLTVACGGARREAESAVAAADSVVAALPPEIPKVIPDRVKAVNDSIAAARQALERRAYDSALVSAQAARAQAEQLAEQSAAQLALIRQDWDTLSVTIPRNLDAVDARLAQIRRTGRLPVGMDRAQLEAAAKTIEDARREWPEIISLFQAGDLAAAMDRALALKGRVSDVMIALGMVSDERAWGNLRYRPLPPS